ncbi:MAG: DUF6391 domain-containing protein [Candidatus Promineifilaceae bacterium]
MSNISLDRIRRNHALEHASINVLTERHKGFSAQGNSTPNGFNLNIYGNIAEDEVYDAVEEAFRRLKAGESRLGLHPTCGTVLLTTAGLAAISAQFVFAVEMKRQGRTKLGISGLLSSLPMATMAVLISLIISKPLGMTIQKTYTVDSELRDLAITSIQPVKPSLVNRLFQLLLGQSKNSSKSYRIKTIG